MSRNPDRPNIVLCTCDQLRAFEVGCYGNDVIRTPNLDRFAAEGVRFDTAVTNYPVCMAARSVLLSGQYNRTCTGGVGNVAYPAGPGRFSLPEYPERGRPHLKDPTLPEILRDHGYETAAIGKWHIHSWPDEVGFDSYLIPRVHHCHTGQSFTENGGPELTPDGYSVDFEAERVAAFLHERRDAARPFFLFYNLSPPHCPLADVPESFRTMYDPREIPLRPNADPETPLARQDFWFRIYRYDFKYYEMHLPYTETLPPGYGLRELTAEYYGAATWMDDAFGRMLSTLNREGMEENTLVVFTADHGDNLGSLGLVQKDSPNEEAVRIPLILRWPHGPAAEGAVVSPLMSLVDVAPTILDLLALPRADHMHGRSAASLVGGSSPAPGDDAAFIESRLGVAVRTPTHMLQLPYRPGTRELADRPDCFYDLRSDPFQQRNMAGSRSRSAAAGEIASRIRNWDATIPWMAK